MIPRNNLKRPTQVLSRSCMYDPTFSFINVLADDCAQQHKQRRKKRQSKGRKEGKSKDRGQKHKYRKPKEKGSKSRSTSCKQIKSKSRPRSKEASQKKKKDQKVNLISKKQYKYADSKPPVKKPVRQNSDRKIVSIKTSTSSMFKRPETVRKRQAQEDNNTTLHGIDERSEAMIKSIPKKRGKLIKSRSDVEMNRITLSEIATDAHKTEGKRQKILHQYFGNEAKLSIFEVKGKKPKGGKQKSKSKGKSVRNSHSQKKGFKSATNFKSTK